MAVKIRDTDKGFKSLKASMIRGDGLKAQAGIQGSEAAAPHDDFGNRNVDIAVFHEFGTATAPERSFIRATVDRERKKYVRLMDRAVKAGLDGESMDRAFGRLALLMASDMVKTIDRSIDLEPLAASTVLARSRKRGRSGLQNLALGVAAAAGGGERPLLDTGQLKRSITGVVIK